MEHAVIIGGVGERLVEAELLKQGFVVATPSVDLDGYDMLVECGPNWFHKLQIKTSKLPALENNKPTGYRFTNFTSRAADFCIFVCLLHNSFYIVPMSKVGSGIKVAGDGSGHSKHEKYFSAWHILKENPHEKTVT